MKTTELDSKFIDDDLVDSIVERVVPFENGTYKWYLNLSTEVLDEFDVNDFVEYCKFDIDFEQCKAYRRQYGNFIRRSQWKEIHVIVYIRVA